MLEYGLQQFNSGERQMRMHGTMVRRANEALPDLATEEASSSFGTAVMMDEEVGNSTTS